MNQGGTFNYMSPESLNDVSHGPLFNGKADKPVVKVSVVDFTRLLLIRKAVAGKN